MTVVDQEFIHRLVKSDGSVKETQPRPYRADQPCFAGVSQFMERRSDPGATVVHLVRSGEGEWQEIGYLR